MSPNDRQDAAREIEQQLPGWMVVYGCFTHQYVAFPLFPAAPAGTILAAAYPPALVNRMRQAERQIFIKSLRGEL